MHPPVGSDCTVSLRRDRSICWWSALPAIHAQVAPLPSDHARGLNGAVRGGDRPIGYATDPGQISRRSDVVADNGSPESKDRSRRRARRLAARDGLTITAVSVVDLPKAQTNPVTTDAALRAGSTRSGTVCSGGRRAEKPSTRCRQGAGREFSSTSICSSAPAAYRPLVAFSSGYVQLPGAPHPLRAPEVLSTKLAEANIAEAAEIEASAIVIGSRGLTGLKSVLLGSVSHAVLQHADLPVIVAPSAEVAAARRARRS